MTHHVTVDASAPEAAKADPSYSWEATLWQMIERRAIEQPDSILVTDEKGTALTSAQFRARAERVAAGLRDRGVRAGSIVSWQLPSNIEAMLVFAALCRLDAVQNPLIMMLREPEVDFITAQARSSLLITTEHFRGYGHGDMGRIIASRREHLSVIILDESLPGGGLPDGDPDGLPAFDGLDPDAIRWFFYTSGTTAEPKGARHRDRHLIAAANVFCTAIRPSSDDRIASVAPMAHVGGILYFLSALVSGARLIITEVFDQVSTTRQLSDARVTLCGSGVPFIQGFLAEQRATPEKRLFPDVKAFLIGGATRMPSLHYSARDELGGVGVVSGYGATEAPFSCWGSLDDDDERHAIADGRPRAGVELRIVKEDGTRASQGEVGEVRIAGPTVMAGYVDKRLDAHAFDQDGYFRTGDLAYLDADGYLVIAGRIKDVIIRNMENISAREVELPIIDHPAVLIAAVIGLPDEKTGERVCAVVVPTNPASPPTLEELCDHLEGHGLNRRKLPVQLEVMSELPLNAMGKVMKQVLRERVLAASAGEGRS